LQVIAVMGEEVRGQLMRRGLEHRSGPTEVCSVRLLLPWPVAARLPRQAGRHWPASRGASVRHRRNWISLRVYSKMMFLA